MMAQITILIAIAVLVSMAGGQYIRSDIDSLSPTQVAATRPPLSAVKSDTTAYGFRAIYALHGEPASCNGDYCCVHNDALFTYWHRAFSLHAEESYNMKGLQLHYWDWTKRMTQMHYMFNDPASNPWYQTTFNIPGVARGTTRRYTDPAFFQHRSGEPTRMCTLILAALQERNFCEFATQLEMAHNSLHVSIGGSYRYSMSRVPYAAMDPIFVPTHAFVDKVITVWQILRTMEGISYDQYDYTGCNLPIQMNTPMEPFNFATNPHFRVKNNAAPINLLNISALNYTYDNYNICDLTPEQLFARLPGQAQSQARTFATLQPQMGADPSTESVEVCSDELNQCVFAGNVSMLGYGKVKKDKPPRVYRFDITYAVKRAGFTGRKDLRGRVKRYIHKYKNNDIVSTFQTAEAAPSPDPDPVPFEVPITTLP